MIQPKFAVGQLVWVAKWGYVEESWPCPDCQGVKTWAITTPAGEKFEVPCYTCERGYEGCSGTIKKWADRPSTVLMTVGSVRVDTYEKEHPVSYMMVETGVGSGTIHYEECVFSERTPAQVFAAQKCEEVRIAREAEQERRREMEKKRSRYKPSWESRRIKELEKRLKELETQSLAWKAAFEKVEGQVCRSS